MKQVLLMGLRGLWRDSLGIRMGWFRYILNMSSSSGLSGLGRAMKHMFLAEL